jgi:hypothetical protein
MNGRTRAVAVIEDLLRPQQQKRTSEPKPPDADRGSVSRLPLCTNCVEADQRQLSAIPPKPPHLHLRHFSLVSSRYDDPVAH